MNVYDGIMQGLQEAVDYNKGEIKARSSTIYVKPIQKYKADSIRSIRNSLGMTQLVFANFMGVSKKTVEAWESGKNTPNGSASRILSMVQLDQTLPEKYNIVVR